MNPSATPVGGLSFARAKLPPWRDAAADIVLGLSIYYLTSLVSVFGALWGEEIVVFRERITDGPASALTGWDGRHYVRIATEGYSYDPAGRSVVAFSPAFPLLGRWIAALTDWPVDVSLVVAAHMSLALAFILGVSYFRRRCSTTEGDAAGWALLAMGLFPTAFFFRMAYTESLFLLVVLMALHSWEGRWPAWVSAVIVGLATAVRPVGVVLLAPLAWNIYTRHATWRARACLSAVCLPLATWGLAAYMAYLHYTFGDALAFAKAQAHWRVSPETTFAGQIAALATLQPIFAVYLPDSPTNWQTLDEVANPFASLTFANPIYFCVAAMLLVVGWKRRWLNFTELALAAGLLAMPYALRGYEMGMGSMGRFVAVAVPLYLVIGQLMVRIPAPAAALVTALAAAQQAAYAALLATGHRII